MSPYNERPSVHPSTLLKRNRFTLGGTQAWSDSLSTPFSCAITGNFWINRAARRNSPGFSKTHATLQREGFWNA